MWVITVFSNEENIKMYEFETEKEARESFDNIHGDKFLTELVNLEPLPSLVMV